MIMDIYYYKVETKNKEIYFTTKQYALDYIRDRQLKEYIIAECNRLGGYRVIELVKDVT